jgi:hypothetical protein
MTQEQILEYSKLCAEFGADNESSSEEEIQTWLDENGYEDEEFNFTQL